MLVDVEQLHLLQPVSGFIDLVNTTVFTLITIEAVNLKIQQIF